MSSSTDLHSASLLIQSFPILDSESGAVSSFLVFEMSVTIALVSSQRDGA